jgi:hypothetical protein
VRDDFANELQRQTRKLAELQNGGDSRSIIVNHGTLQTLNHQDSRPDDLLGQADSTATAIQVEREMILLMTENGVLDSLDFPTMQDRHEDVDIAHKKTFEWIYKEASPAEQSWSNFSRWLQHGDGIYWINGKAGSGKSTLMKHLFGHLRTRQELKQWAGNSKYVMSGFFFWNSGNEEQRSQKGLLRTILFETLQTHRDLIPTVLPTAWDAWTTRVKRGLKMGTLPLKSSLLAHDSRPWTLSQLKKAFQRLIQECRQRDIKVCLFIDGLDEYDGQHEDIADYFLEANHEPGIKMCLSSRPLVVFEEAFSDFPLLKLQSLTHRDISCYVQDKLASHRSMARISKEHPEQATRLVTEIVTKADGVFLWVKLVVKSLLQGLRDQNRISDLERRLKHLPADLEALYAHMLQRTDPLYLEQASQIFQICVVAQKESTSRQITLLQLSWAEDRDESLALKASLRPLGTEEIARRCREMDIWLKSVCSGLLESYDAKYAYIAPDARVVFLHRTVSDFFKKPSVWLDVVKHTQGTRFSPHLSLLRSCVLQLKTLKTDAVSPLDMSIIRDALNFANRAERDLNTGFPLLLDQLDAAATYQWRMVSGRAMNGRLHKANTARNRLAHSQGISSILKSSGTLDTISSDSERDSDEYFDARPDVEPLVFSSALQTQSITAQSARDSTRDGSQARWTASTPISISHSVKFNTLQDSTIAGGFLYNWTSGIEFEGVKPFGARIPFYELAKALGLKHYVADKDRSGIVVDHDVNRHMLLHAVTSYSGTGGHSRTPDLSVIQRALEAGADPNFSFHSSTPWEEVLTRSLAHVSVSEFNDLILGSNYDARHNWETDAENWLKLMKVFLQYGANPVGSSNHYMGRKLKPVAILRYFPASLSAQLEELRVILDSAMTNLTSKGAVGGSETLESEELCSRDKLSASELRATDREEATNKQSVSTLKWLLSWIISDGKRSA